MPRLLHSLRYLLQTNVDYNCKFSPSLCTHYENNGHRTINIAESWHKGLNSRFGVPHPLLRVFLDWRQKCESEVQWCCVQLAAGRQLKAQTALYAQLDARLWSAKVAYSMQIRQLFTPVFLDQHFSMHQCIFLSQASYLLGCVYAYAYCISMLHDHQV